GVRVVAVDTPGAQHAIDVAVGAGAADEVHHLVVAVFLDGCADLRGDGVEGFVPRGALILPAAAGAGALERVQDALGVLDLAERRRPLGAGLAAGAGVVGGAPEAAELGGVLLDVRHRPAAGVASGTGGGDMAVALFDLRRPGAGLVFHPV